MTDENGAAAAIEYRIIPLEPDTPYSVPSSWSALCSERHFQARSNVPNAADGPIKVPSDVTFDATPIAHSQVDVQGPGLSRPVRITAARLCAEPMLRSKAQRRFPPTGQIRYSFGARCSCGPETGRSPVIRGGRHPEVGCA